MKSIVFLLLVTTTLLSVACSRKLSSSPGNTPGSLKIMSYNVHHCNPPDKENVIDVNAIAEVIKKEQPDIVALQEIDVNTHRSGNINEAALLAEKTGYRSFHFAKAIDFDGGQYGVMILSRYALDDTKVYALPTDESTNGEHRVLATGVVNLPSGGKLLFGCTHLDALQTDVNRRLQIKEIVKIADSTTMPFVIAGDFNATEGSDVINSLDSRFTRTCKQCLPTLNEENVKHAIDFISFKPGNSFMVESHKVLRDANTSDHYAVSVVLKF